MSSAAEKVYAGRTADFDDDNRRKVRVGDAEVVVLRWRGEYFAFQNRCRHQGGPVAEGVIMGCVKGVLDEEQRYLGERFDDSEPHLVCPWHGYEYDLYTGRFVGDPSLSIRRYDTHVEGDEIYVQP